MAWPADVEALIAVSPPARTARVAASRTQVRAEAADAYQKRQKARDEEAPAEQKRLLAAAALQLLAAASRVHEAPDPVEPKEARRWVALAGRCLQACGSSDAAAQLFLKAGHHDKALKMLLAAKQHGLAGRCCLDAAESVLAAHGEAGLQQQQQQSGGGLALPLGLAGGGPANTPGGRAAVPGMAKAAEQFFLANDLQALVNLLAPRAAPAAPAAAGDGWRSDDEDEGAGQVDEASGQAGDLESASRPALHAYLREHWRATYGRALQCAAYFCQGKGMHGQARRLLRQVPQPAERDAVLAKLGYWRELGRIKRYRRSTNCLRQSLRMAEKPLRFPGRY